MGAKASRAAFGEAIVEVGATNPRVVVVDADLSKSTMTGAFAETYPDRHYEIGIAEGNMVGIGAGLALGGKIPFICSFGCFVVGRFEQIRISIAYSRTNVKIVGTHVGIGIGEDGYSQMGLEDMAMNLLSNMLDAGRPIAVYDDNVRSVRIAAGKGAKATYSIPELVLSLSKPRTVWLMVPSEDVPRILKKHRCLHFL